MGSPIRIAIRLLAWLVQRGADTVAVAWLMPVIWPSEEPDIFPPWVLVLAWMLMSGYAFTTLHAALTAGPGRLITYAGWHAVLFFLHLVLFFGFFSLMGFFAARPMGAPPLLFVLGPMAAFASAIAVRAGFSRFWPRPTGDKS